MNYTRNQQCRCCKDIFIPDYRNARKQKYCSKPACRAASKKAGQKKWTDKNPHYFKDKIHVERVRKWRKANPGRSRRKSSDVVLQDHCDLIADVNQDVTLHFPTETPVFATESPVLQDFCITQHPVIIGIISHLTGCVLQDEIDAITRRLEQLGQDVINPNPGGCYDPQVPNLPRSHPLHSRTVQLGGSPSGP
jgi:hypothetical protein